MSLWRYKLEGLETVTLYGLKAITAHKGWSMAIIGIAIDFTGLAILALVISQLHKVLEFWDNKGKKPKAEKSNKISQTTEKDNGMMIPDIFPDDIIEAAQYYKPLFEQLGKKFQLKDLYGLAQEKNYPHPHLTINSLRQVGILSPLEDGIFTWNFK